MYVFHAHAVQNESDRRFDSVRPHSHRAHVRPVRACSCSARARLAPLPRPRAKSEPAPIRSRADVFPASAVGPAPPLFFARPDSPRSSASARPCPEPVSPPSRPAPPFFRPPAPASLPELSPAVPPASAPRPKTHNAEPAQHDDGPKIMMLLPRPGSEPPFPSIPRNFSFSRLSSSFLLPGSGSAQKKTARRRPFFFGTNACRRSPALRPSDGSACSTPAACPAGNTAGRLLGCAPGCASGSFRQTACHSEATSTKFCTHCATFEPSSMRMDITP